jgi:mono/diheme cytochrome c family protein
MRAALLPLGLVLCGACAAFEPEVGKLLEERCDDADSDPARPTRFSLHVRPLLEERCVGCHTPGGFAPIGVEVGGLDLSTYASLRAGGVVSGARIIVPGSPCASALLDKVGPSPSFGARMPLSGPPFLEDDQIQLLADWVAEGARED